jgi:DNA-binding CsgD family transcriptional regulator
MTVDPADEANGHADDALPGESVREFAAVALDTLSQAIPLTASCCYTVGADLQATHLELRNIEQTWLAAYRRHFCRIDPLHPRNFRDRPCRVAVLDPDERPCAQSRQYLNDYLKPRGACYRAEVFLRDDAGIFAGFSLLRATHLGSFAMREVRLLEALVPLLEISATRTMSRNWRRPRHGSLNLNLTSRERSIAAMIAEGRSNKEICRLLGIGLPTVKTHVRHIFSKANVSSRTAFISRVYLQH